MRASSGARAVTRSCASISASLASLFPPSWLPPLQPLPLLFPALLPSSAAAAAAATAATAIANVTGSACDDAACEDAACDDAACEDAAAPSAFEWLPSPERWFPTLDDALDVMCTRLASSPSSPDETPTGAAGDSGVDTDELASLEERFNKGRICLGTEIAEAAAAAAAAATQQQPRGSKDVGSQPAVDVWRPPPNVKLIVDPTLSVLARKLRMVGLDCTVAGEVLRASPPQPQPAGRTLGVSSSRGQLTAVEPRQGAGAPWLASAASQSTAVRWMSTDGTRRSRGDCS